MAEPPSSPPSESASAEDALAWYKSQYEQLEHELSEFRASSHELEQELEKELEAADKRQRALEERAEGLSFEVEEWKRKYRESKAEANAAQSTLEKEITTLRDANRTLQLRLRDIEVANDDFERQARRTHSSLEDMESKYNVAIERAVMMEEEIRLGELEREKLRIETQRLRDELSDLKIETEILQDKVKKYESRHLSTISTDISVPESPTFENSPNSTASSPLITTPPEMKPDSTPTPVAINDPPSPPMSDTSVPLPKALVARTPASTSSSVRRSRLPSADHSVTPKPRHTFASSTSSNASIRPPGTGSRIVTANVRTPAPKSAATPAGASAAARARSGSHKIPPSNSLAHIRTLTAQMQRLEARVQSARSKLPAPSTTSTPPRPSPRSSLPGPGSGIPSSVTIRSRKRGPGSSAASVSSTATANNPLADDTTPTSIHHHNAGSITTPATTGGHGHSYSKSSHVPRLSTSGVSRLSFGPLPNRNPTGESDASRPSSRASVTSSSFGFQHPARPASRAGGESMIPPPRPMSRASLGGARTPLGLRSRSSLSGSLHGMSGMYAASGAGGADEGEDSFVEEFRSPSRTGTAPSGIPVPSSRRQSGVSGIPVPSSSGLGGGRRISGGGTAVGAGASQKLRQSQQGAAAADLGETY